MVRLYTYKITLSNTTSTATPPNLQVRLNINFASLVSNINADLGNIRFSSDQAGNNLLYAWLESAPQGTFTQSSSVSSYTSSNVWVNLGNNIIPANGSLTIYMQVLSSGTEFDGVYWGANPQWTNIYGQYDNGAKVFNSYWNFAGITLPSAFTTAGTGSYTVNNGITVTGNDFEIIASTSSGNNIIDGLVNANSSTNGNLVLGYGGGASTYTLYNGYTINLANGYNNLYAYISGTPNSIASGSWNLTTAVYTLAVSSSPSQTGFENYVNKGSATNSQLSLSNFNQLAIGAATGGSINVNWLRTRTYPPNGTDPVLTSIILLVGNYISASIPSPEWTTLSGKPYVTVSAKGISNGLSNIFNDGADFGPDTLLGVSLPNQYGPPYTQTSGIQEAINYAVMNDRAVYLLNGIYSITAPLTTIPNNTSFSAQIIVPYNPNQPTTRLTVIGEDYGNINEISGNMSTQGVIIYNNLTPLPNPTVSPYPFMWAHEGGGQFNCIYKGFTLRQPSTTQQINGMLMENVNTYDVDIKIDIDQPINTGAPSTPPSSGLAVAPLGVAFQTSSESSQSGYNRVKLVVFGYNRALLSYSQTEVESLTAEYCVIAIQQTASLHPSIFHYINTNNCAHIFNLYGNGSESYINIIVESADIQDNLNASGYWFGTVDHINFTYPPLYVTGFIRYARNPQGSSIPVNSPLIISQTDFPANFYLKTETFDNAELIPSITANPPVTATVYRNTNPYDIRIYLPAYATTSGTAGSVAIALGSTSTPTAIGTKFINGSTSSSATEIIELVVPAGWYYEFTSTGVTFGTATVLPA
ncbi:MAG: hypothetical protein QW478_08080 [Candidatus Micrarchaeaceae archaeon]